MHEQERLDGTTQDPVNFRRRGKDVSRIEGFSDAVFAFALTLLVVSLEVPKTFDELLATLSGFLPFALSFAIFIFLWYQHYAFFRRYALQDGLTILLNSALLLVVLFFVFPSSFSSRAPSPPRCPSISCASS